MEINRVCQVAYREALAAQLKLLAIEDAMRLHRVAMTSLLDIGPGRFRASQRERQVRLAELVSASEAARLEFDHKWALFGACHAKNPPPP